MTTPSAGSDDDFVPQYTPPAWYTTQPWNDIADANTPIPWHSLGAAPAPPEPACHVCQAHPATCAEIRSHTGLILWARTSTITTPLCRQCGISLVRTMTTRTLWQGWWGILSLLIHTPAALLQNWGAHRRFKALSVSAPPPGRTSLAPGKPVLLRPQAYVALIPVAWATTLIVQLPTG
ncbi:hypothetical protein [Streptomyces sp. NPDC004528]|uniref:hypothetical protein n=1 Tax=Streptomyces sp. NPDC004528 TaxID=3154550 RepID=UPI0033A82B92